MTKCKSDRLCTKLMIYFLHRPFSEALNLANQLCQYGYFFPVSDSKNLVVKDDSSLYRFQVGERKSDVSIFLTISKWDSKWFWMNFCKLKSVKYVNLRKKKQSYIMFKLRSTSDECKLNWCLSKINLINLLRIYN